MQESLFNDIQPNDLRQPQLHKAVDGFAFVAYVRWLVCRQAMTQNPCYGQLRFNNEKVKMEIQTSLWERPVLPADIVYTPNYVSEHIVRWLNPKGKCLDPCKGDGAFYNYLPECVVYKDENTLNTKIENLIEANRSQTNYRRKLPKTNTSKIKGVSIHKPTGKWQATCKVNKIQHYLGIYEDIKEAEKVVKQFRETNHKEFANHG